jgi:hypothetical protein
MELEKTILNEVKPGSEDQKSYVLPHMWIIDLKQMQYNIGHGSHTEERTRTGRTGKKKEI